jgi:hypothetical protein
MSTQTMYAIIPTADSIPTETDGTTVQEALDGLGAFSRGGTFLSPSAPVVVVVGRASFACRIVAVKGLREGGSATGTRVTARKNGVSHLSAPLHLTSSGVWMDGGAVSDVDYIVGDLMEIQITALGGIPSQVAIQIDLERS